MRTAAADAFIDAVREFLLSMFGASTLMEYRVRLATMAGRRLVIFVHASQILIVAKWHGMVLPFRENRTIK